MKDTRPVGTVLVNSQRPDSNTVVLLHCTVQDKSDRGELHESVPKVLNAGLAATSVAHLLVFGPMAQVRRGRGDIGSS